MNKATHTRPWANLRLPYHLRPGTLVVLTGPCGRTRQQVMQGLWQAAMGLGHGTQPLFDHVPVFTHRPTAESLAAAGDTTDMKVAQAVHARAVVRPALAAGRSVFMDGWSWDDPAQPELADGLSPHVVGVFSGEPTQTSPVAIETYRRRIATSRTQAIELSGHRGDATEGLFLALIRAGLFMSKPEDAHP